MENKIDFTKKVSELTAGELHALISNAVYQALLDKEALDSKITLDLMKPIKL